MSEEAQAETSIERSTASTEVSQPNSERPEGWELVDYDRLRDKAGPEQAKVVEARINRLWGQLRETEKLNKQLIADHKVLVERLDTMSKSDTERETERLKADIQQAAQAGEYDKLATLTDRLTKLNSQDRGSAKPQETAAAKPTEQQADTSPRDISEALTAEQEAQLRVWASETDDQGTLRRPWMQPGHPKHNAAMLTIQAVLQDPDHKERSALEIMAETDRRMGVRQTRQVAAPAVLSSTIAPRTGNAGVPKLTEQQARIADNLGVKRDRYAKMLGQTGRRSDGKMAMSYAVDS